MVPRYIREETPLGTAGALYKYKDQLLADREYVFLLHSDICCTFPLKNLLEAHKAQPNARMTMMGTTVSIIFSCLTIRWMPRSPRLMVVMCPVTEIEELN